jgi:hypothetical protein
MRGPGVTEEAFEAITATLPVGSVAFEPEITKGLRQLWLERVWVDKLAGMRQPGERYSDVIVRVAAAGA